MLERLNALQMRYKFNKGGGRGSYLPTLFQRVGYRSIGLMLTVVEWSRVER